MSKPWKSFSAGLPACCHYLCRWTCIPPGRRSCPTKEIFKLCWNAHGNIAHDCLSICSSCIFWSAGSHLWYFMVSTDDISDIFWSHHIAYLIFSDFTGLHFLLESFARSPGHPQPPTKAEDNWNIPRKYKINILRKYNQNLKQGNVQLKQSHQVIFILRDSRRGLGKVISRKGSWGRILKLRSATYSPLTIWFNKILVPN